MFKQEICLMRSGPVTINTALAVSMHNVNSSNALPFVPAVAQELLQVQELRQGRGLE